ncbi:MAG: glycosyltransferase family 39 protein [Candidatus Hydrogenedentes bacterium]|nr:glycosyltransferase family 39 protein [Candidatus Hydrogenedentota bacterium]
MTRLQALAPLRAPSPKRLLSLYVRGSLWYSLLVAGMALVGFESIYLNPTPFHALFAPAGGSWAAILTAFLLLALGVFVCWRHLNPGYVVSRRRASLLIVLIVAGGLVTRRLAVHDAVASVIPEATVWGTWWSAFRWHLMPVVLTLAVLFVGAAYCRILPWKNFELTRRQVRWFLVTMILFTAFFSIAVAMVRDGMAGVTDAYERSKYEYIGDIGKTSGIRTLFGSYNELHPYLSMHSKVHPPGPVAILWIMSIIIFSANPGPLSVTTVILGSTALIPLWLLARCLFSTRIAIMSCILYSLIPSIVLFTATSADILFMPLTLWTLYFFWRAIHGPSTPYALCAGVMYGVLSLTSFSLIGIGVFFGFVGLWRLLEPERRIAVIRTAALMLAAFLGCHLAVRFWSGFDVVECFRLAKSQFDEDQANLQVVSPRFPGWAFRLLNPVCMFYFAGIPVSMLLVWRLCRPEPGSKGLFIVFGLTLFVLNLLYIARGEGERSAMYVLPFAVIPAAHLLEQLCERTRSFTPLLVTAGFLAIQTWLTESLLYTYW